MKISNEIEDELLRALTKLLLRLNEKMFRPLFLQLMDWAKLQTELNSIDPALLGNKAILNFRSHYRSKGKGH